MVILPKVLDGGSSEREKGTAMPHKLIMCFLGLTHPAGSPHLAKNTEN